jgi:hypothetical protein
VVQFNAAIEKAGEYLCSKLREHFASARRRHQNAAAKVGWFNLMQFNAATEKTGEFLCSKLREHFTSARRCHNAAAAEVR